MVLELPWHLYRQMEIWYLTGKLNREVAEQADAHVLKTCGVIREGSSPSFPISHWSKQPSVCAYAVKSSDCQWSVHVAQVEG